VNGRLQAVGDTFVVDRLAPHCMERVDEPEALQDEPIASPVDPPAGESEQPHPLDHDNDGEPGGSVSHAERGLSDLVAEAESLGIKVDKRWGAKRLQKEIDKAKPQ